MARRVTCRFGPAQPPTPPKPFTVLAKPRLVPPGLPSDLAAWYRKHEGVGLRGPSTHSVRLFKMAELKPVRAADIGLFGGAPDPVWDDFRGLRIAIGNDLEEMVYTVAGTAHRFGSILALGRAVANGGVLVLDVNFGGWLARLARDEWVEWGLHPVKIAGLLGGKAHALQLHFGRLNPGLKW